MKILALESSAKAASAAVCDGEKLLAQYYQNTGLTHSRTLLKMAEDMLGNLEMTMDELDAIAVAVGPGSFTGIRIGVAAAKGLAWGAEKPLIAVSTLEAMIWQSRREDCVICPVMDARRSQVYNALFEFSYEGPARLTPDRAISVDQLIGEAKSSEKPFFLVGDGAEMCYNLMTDAGCAVILAPPMLRFQTAAGVARSALDLPAVSPNDVVPNYLRLSQAERERLERENRNTI